MIYGNNNEEPNTPLPGTPLRGNELFRECLRGEGGLSSFLTYLPPPPLRESLGRFKNVFSSLQPTQLDKECFRSMSRNVQF